MKYVIPVAVALRAYAQTSFNTRIFPSFYFFHIKFHKLYITKATI